MIKRIKKEIWMHKYIKAGYPRRVASRWYYRVRKDDRLWKDIYSKDVLDKIHSMGFFAKNIERLGLLDNPNCDRISDLDYLRLRPINSSFTKWIEDINTINRVLYQHKKYIPNVYFSLYKRDGLNIVKFPRADRRYDVKDIIAFLKENSDKEYHIRPAFWNSNGKRLTIKYNSDNSVYVDRKPYSLIEFKEMISESNQNQVLCDKVYYDYRMSNDWKFGSYIKFYLTNDKEGKEKVLCAAIEKLEHDNYEENKQFLVDVGSGKFIDKDLNIEVTIPRWDAVVEKIVDITSAVQQIAFFSISIVLEEDGFKIINCNHNPFLPKGPCSKELNDYLLGLLSISTANKITFKSKVNAFRSSFFNKFVRKYCRHGIRPYMQQLWFDAVKDDFNDKSTTMREKIWAWKRGFLSFRIKQYGLTEENYKEFLSDYDYHWLNRINGVFQGWINDKTTFRYTMEPIKEYVPEYYFSVYKRLGKARIAKMQDCPEHITADYNGILDLLKEKKKLVFKPSAGTHGDGFYCIAFDGKEFLVNNEVKTPDELINIIESQKSFYIITDYIVMHETLKAIYPNSVDSIRVMVLNERGYNPKIRQCYLRIGSSKTGFTDNVGYGGICAMVNMETGELYDPETLKDHVYYPCEHHPDTGTKISGIVIPHWKLICEKVIEIAQLMPELEYLGFDVAVTENGFNVMEINVHQDLHKVALHPEDVRKFYKDKIAYKKRLLKIS